MSFFDPMKYLIMAFAVSLASMARPDDAPAITDEYASKAMSCIKERVSSIAAKEQSGYIEWTDMTAFYFSTRLMESTGSGTVQNSCEMLVKEYVALASESQKKRQEAWEKDPSLAPLGSGEIVSDSWFVEKAQNLHFKHLRGHFDLTLEGLPAIDVRGDSPAARLLARASQTPDLYRWSAEVFHAHTAEYSLSDAQDRTAKIQDSQVRFRRKLTDIIETAIVDANNLDIESALFRVGVAAHMVQDLAFHRGITLRQHAGLAYVLHRNPDLPNGALAGNPWNEAVSLTVRLLSTVRAKLPSGTWNALWAWQPDAKFDFTVFARRVYDAKEDTGVLPISEYYALSLPYRSVRSKIDLEMRSDCATGPGLPCWDPGSVVNGILQ